MERDSLKEAGLAGVTGPLPRPRVRPVEYLVSAGGLLLLGGLFLAWSGETSGYESFSLLKFLLVILGIAAVVLPFLVTLSPRSSLPITWELLLSILATFLVLVLLVRLLFPPSGGLTTGFFVTGAAALLILTAGWRSVAREC